MERILLALTMFGLFLPAAQQLKADDVSFDFFYNNLNDGNWVEVGDYGYCWQPSVAESDRNWRPYADGYWAYTDVGWTWVANEDFGWATYHYGRWARLQDRGWIWVPGTEWGPAWVSWRTGGDVVGWAPLPPARSGELVYEGRAINGQVDIEFDIGPSYYNFVDVRYIGEPRLRDRIYEPSRNVTFISNSVNVTNITYSNSTVYNYGPDYNQLSQRSTRPIQRLTLERQTNVAAGAAIQPGAVMKVESGKLIVAAPMKVNKAPPTVAPKVVKAKIPQPKLETGWSGISDPNAKAQLQQKMKAEDAKKVPPANAQPTPGAAGGKAPSPAPTAAPAITPVGSAAPTQAASPATSPVTSPVPASPPTGKGKGRGAQRVQPGATPLGTPVKALPTSSSNKGAKPVESNTPAPAASVPPKGAMTKGPKQEAEQDREKAGRPTFSPARKATPSEAGMAPTTPKQEKTKAPMNEPPAGPEGQSKMGHQGKSKIEHQVPSSTEAAPPEQGKARGPAQRTVAPAGNAPQDSGQARGGEGKQLGPKKPKKGGEPSPSASPGE
jgi:Family of unknown function (DUF6600)